jgi:hypothetical protein
MANGSFAGQKSKAHRVWSMFCHVRHEPLRVLCGGRSEMLIMLNALSAIQQ